MSHDDQLISILNDHSSFSLLQWYLPGKYKNTSRDLPTFLFFITEAVCYNFFLLFLYSQAIGLCVAVDTDKSKAFDQREVSVHLSIGGVNRQYFPYCGKLESSSVDSSYTFSCTMDPTLRKAVMTVIGYDTTIEDEWKSTFKVTVEDDCLKIKCFNMFVSGCLCMFMAQFYR